MRIKFLLGATLTSAVDQSAGAWTTVTATFAVKDWEGVNLGTGVAAGDVVWMDTGAFEPGTVTEYSIAAVGAKTATSVTVTLSFTTTDHPAPDLSYSVGGKAVITRKTTNKGLFPLFSPSVQQLPDKLAFYAQNRNAGIADAETTVVVGATAPANPVPGQVWVKT